MSVTGRSSHSRHLDPLLETHLLQSDSGGLDSFWGRLSDPVWTEQVHSLVQPLKRQPLERKVDAMHVKPGDPHVALKLSVGAKLMWWASRARTPS